MPISNDAASGWPHPISSVIDSIIAEGAQKMFVPKQLLNKLVVILFEPLSYRPVKVLQLQGSLLE